MSFDHLQTGTAEQTWAGPLGQLAQLDLPADKQVLVVLAAHPDDETLGAGGLIATAAAAGWSVRVLVATDGEASHPHSPTHTPSQLAHRRRRELTQAMAMLGTSVRVHFAGLPDGGVAEHADQLAVELATLADGPCLILAPWRHDRHPDHEACGDVAANAAGPDREVWQYPIWAWHWGRPDTVPIDSMRRFPLPADARAAKRAALQCHVSQHSPLSGAAGDEAILGAGLLAHFERDFEIFQPMGDSTPPEYFDELYRASDDPWGLAERHYELRKREIMLASLPRSRFATAFEPGCATGLVTEQLARRCDEVLAVDTSARAVELTRARVSRPGVRVARGRIPEDWPAEQFELIVLSEVGYYCRDLGQLVALVDASLTAGGVVLACHWRHPAAEHPHSAEAVHAALGRRFRATVTHLERDFRLEVFSREGRSVAQDEAIAP
jgi:LmbE family N-acetylglucosaminyl deacetylase